MDGRSERSESTRSDTVVDARTSLALWLRAGRAQRGMSLDDVAKVTKIQPRILERLEAGRHEGLPAEVFVRGFVRSFARCVGLDEDEALRRYAACGGLAAGSGEITPAARALVDAMSELAPTVARATPRKMEAVEDVGFATGTIPPLNRVIAKPASEAPVANAPVATAALADAAVADAGIVAATAESDAVESEPIESDAIESATLEPAAMDGALSDVGRAAVAVEPPRESGKKKKGSRRKRNKRAARLARQMLAVGTPPGASPVIGDDSLGATWAPKMPPFATSSGVPWRRPASSAPAAAVPSLVIDDADPDSAERVLEERAERREPRRSFLPPILLDREDRSSRQGGLTLAVILLLIAATLTLSYLMRRPSASGDGMTRLEAPVELASARG